MGRPPSGALTPLPPGWGNRGTCAPRDLYIAVRTNEVGVVTQAAGLFLDEADAKAHVAADYGGNGYPVPFELVFRSPPQTPPGARPPGHPRTAGRPTTP